MLGHFLASRTLGPKALEQVGPIVRNSTVSTEKFPFGAFMLDDDGSTVTDEFAGRLKAQEGGGHGAGIPWLAQHEHLEMQRAYRNKARGSGDTLNLADWENPTQRVIC